MAVKKKPVDRHNFLSIPTDLETIGVKMEARFILNDMNDWADVMEILESCRGLGAAEIVEIEGLK